MGGMTVDLVPGRIPWRLIDRYAARYGITGEEFEFFARMVEELDTEWVAWRREQQATE